jgi:hypothetical protein
MATYKPIDADSLAISLVNNALGLSLKPGPVHFSASAQEHADDRHPIDYPICVAYFDRILKAPDWVGQSPKQKDGFILVRRIRAANANILVAIKLQPDAKGRYIVASTYRLSEADIAARLAKGHLWPT